MAKQIDSGYGLRDEQMASLAQELSQTREQIRTLEQNVQMLQNLRLETVANRLSRIEDDIVTLQVMISVLESRMD